MMLRIHPRNPKDIQVEIAIKKKKKSWLLRKVQKVPIQRMSMA